MTTIKYVKKEYEVLEGDIPNMFCPVVHHHRHEIVSEEPPRSELIQMPYTVGQNDGLADVPPAKERYKIIKRAQEAGLYLGVQVVRVCYISPNYLANPRMIGTIQRFLFNIWPGRRQYLPILVRYTNADGSFQDFPFGIEEIDTLENAKKQLNLFVGTCQPHKDIIDNVLPQRNGVIPFQRGAIPLSLPHKRD